MKRIFVYALTAIVFAGSMVAMSSDAQAFHHRHKNRCHCHHVRR